MAYSFTYVVWKSKLPILVRVLNSVHSLHALRAFFLLCPQSRLQQWFPAFLHGNYKIFLKSMCVFCNYKYQSGLLLFLYRMCVSCRTVLSHVQPPDVFFGSIPGMVLLMMIQTGCFNLCLSIQSCSLHGPASMPGLILQSV